MNKKTLTSPFTKAQRARALPAPGPSLPIIVPLSIYLEYKELHGIEPIGYDEKKAVLLCKKIETSK